MIYEYGGCQFESVEQARWAVVFDNLGLEWSYHPTTYLMDEGIMYVPDFFLPEVKTSFALREESYEKGLFISEIESGWPENDTMFSRNTEIPLWLVGVFPDGTAGNASFDFIDNNAYWISSKGGADGRYLFCICTYCNQVGVEFEGRSDRIPCGCDKPGDKGYNATDPRIMASFRNAQRMTFAKSSPRRQS